MLVVLFHVGVIMGQPEYGGGTPSFGTLTIGWIGVNFFFVLSGFIILHAHAKDIGHPEKIRVYAWRRFARVYPIYWVLLTVFVGAAWAGIGHPDFSFSLANMVAAYSLVQIRTDISLPLKVAWTLLFEVQFYALFGLAILNRKLGIIVFGIWLLVIIASGFLDRPASEGFSNVWSLNFLCGGVAYWMASKANVSSGAWLFAIGVGLLGLLVFSGIVPRGMELAPHQPLMMVALGLTFAAVLAGAVLLERRFSFAPPKSLLLIGDASYSIYLVHSAVISVSAQIYHALMPGFLSPDTLFVVLAAGSVVAGCCIHLLVERPMMSLLVKPSATRSAARTQRLRSAPASDTP